MKVFIILFRTFNIKLVVFMNTLISSIFDFHRTSTAISEATFWNKCPTDDLSKKIFPFIQSGCSSKKAKELKNDISHIAPGQLKQVLHTVIEDLLKSTDDPEKAMERLAQILPLEQLQEAIRTEFPQHIDALHTAKEMFQQAKYFLDQSKTSFHPSLHTRMHAVFDSIISIIESFISAFGIADFFKPADSEIQAEFKGQKIMMLISLFTLISTTLIPVLGPALAGGIVGGTMLFIASLSLVYPHIRPVPSQLPKGENWQKKLNQGELFSSSGREDVIDDIAYTLIESDDLKTYPLLIGRSGVGKTETVKRFAQEIENKKYSKLIGKKVIYFNSADLVNDQEMFGGGNRSLSKIMDATKGHEDKFIIIFDEIQLTCQKGKKATLGDQLKTRLDPGNRGFPYFIGITTEEEFYRDIYVNNAAFARRFKRINIDNTTPSETLEILNNTFLRQAPKIILEKGALESIISKTTNSFPETAQPAAAMKILSKCIQKTAEWQKSPLEKKMGLIRGQIQSMHSQGAVGHGVSLLPYHDSVRLSKIQSLEKELAELETKLSEEKKDFSRLFQLRDHLVHSKKTIFETVLKISKMRANVLNQTHVKELNKFLLLSHFLAPAIELKVKTEATRLGVKTVLNSNLINSVILERKENNRKVQEALERGKKQCKEKTA